MIYILVNFLLFRHTAIPEGHPFKIFKTQLQRDVRAHSFSQRIIDDWNKLPYEVVTAPTLSQFKRQFDSFYRYIFYNT